jgi:hypothetical protein
LPGWWALATACNQTAATPPTNISSTVATAVPICHGFVRPGLAYGRCRSGGRHAREARARRGAAGVLGPAERSKASSPAVGWLSHRVIIRRRYENLAEATFRIRQWPPAKAGPQLRGIDE